MAKLSGRVIDLNHSYAARQAWSDEFAERLKPHMQPFDWSEVERMAAEWSREERENRSIAVRLIGDDCMRRVQYECSPHFWGKIPDRAPMDDASYFNFARGTYGEAWMCNLLCRAGIDVKRFDVERARHNSAPEWALKYADERGLSWWISAAGDLIRGNADGVIVGDDWRNPNAYEFPCVWEHKAVGKKSWQALYNHGLRKAKPQYAAQVALYQFYLDLQSPALFTAYNADTGAVYAELVPLDPVHCQQVIDDAVKLVRAMKSRELLPRISNEPDRFPCGWRDKKTGEMTGCRFRGECWGL